MPQQFVDLVDRVLAVAVDLHDRVGSVFRCVAEAGTQGAADAEVDRQSDHHGSGFLGDLGGAVGAGIVDHDAVVPQCGDRFHHLADARLLFVGGYDDDDFRHVGCSRSRTRRASRACASAVVRSRSCSSDTLIDNWMKMPSSRTELIITRTAVGVMLATLPRRPTNGMFSAARATNKPTPSHPSAYLVVSSRRRARPRMTSTITPPPSARTRACFTDVDMSASVNDDRSVVGCSPRLPGDSILL